ncbi:MAG: hypothetical protein ACRDYW_05545 [Acidimicrobiales bacterium]
MTTWGAAAAALAVLLGLAGCSGGDDDDATTTTDRTTTSSTTTEPERPASTTTTAYDPAAIEGQVEAAYLRSWDVYADAVYHLELDEQALAEVYAEASLATRTSEISERIDTGRAAHVRIDHDYEVVLVDDTTAAVVDHFLNHQVLIDPGTKEPVEPDPNERLLVNFQMKAIDGQWKVTLIQKVNP